VRELYPKSGLYRKAYGATIDWNIKRLRIHVRKLGRAIWKTVGRRGV